MIKLKIVNIDGYKYNLEDEDEHNYIINLEFFCKKLRKEG